MNRILSIIEIPERGKMKEVMQTFNETEIKEMADKFETNVLAGHHQVFVSRHDVSYNRDAISNNLDIAADVIYGHSWGEGAYVCDKLANGYRQAKKRFTPTAYKDLMNTGLGKTYTENGFYWQSNPEKEQEIAKSGGDELFHKSTNRDRGKIAISTEILDLYIPENNLQHDTTDAGVDISNTGFGLDTKNKLVRVVNINTRAYKCINVNISNNRSLLRFCGDTRASSLTVLIVLKPRNEARCSVLC